MQCKALGVGVAVGLLAAASAHAQDRRHIGVEGQVQVLYDSNVARSSDAVAAARGVGTADTIITPQLVVDILMPVSRQSLFLVGSAGRQYYAKNDFLNSAHYNLNGGLHYRASVCQGTLGATYVYGQSDLQDLTFAATRNIEETTGGSFDIACGRATGLAPNFKIAKTSSDNSALVLSDYRTTTTSVGLGYRRPTFGEVSIYGQHDETDYVNRLAFDGASFVRDGYETNAVGIRYVRRLGARIGGEIAVGYQEVDPIAISLEDFSGVTYSALVDYRISSKLNANLRMSRGAEPTIQPGTAFTISQTLQIGASYQVGSRLNLSGGVMTTDNRYKGSGLLPTTSLTSENIDSVYANARWDLSRRVAVSGLLRYEQRGANLPGFDYSSFQAGLTLIGKF